jgi:hypothetical protein
METINIEELKPISMEAIYDDFHRKMKEGEELLKERGEEFVKAMKERNETLKERREMEADFRERLIELSCKH